jgi:hypothetical protein
MCIGIWSALLFLAIVVPIIIQKLNPEKGPFCTIPYLI